MRAVVLNGPWDLSLQDRPEPEARPGQVEVRIASVGVCDADTVKAVLRPLS